MKNFLTILIVLTVTVSCRFSRPLISVKDSEYKTENMSLANDTLSKHYKFWTIRKAKPTLASFSRKTIFNSKGIIISEIKFRKSPYKMKDGYSRSKSKIKSYNDKGELVGILYEIHQMYGRGGMTRLYRTKVIK